MIYLNIKLFNPLWFVFFNINFIKTYFEINNSFNDFVTKRAMISKVLIFITLLSLMFITTIECYDNMDREVMGGTLKSIMKNIEDHMEGGIKIKLILILIFNLMFDMSVP